MRICAIVGGIYAVSSIIESVIRNSIGIFGFGETANRGASSGQRKRVQSHQPVPTNETTVSDEGSAI